MRYYTFVFSLAESILRKGVKVHITFTILPPTNNTLKNEERCNKYKQALKSKAVTIIPIYQRSFCIMYEFIYFNILWD